MALEVEFTIDTRMMLSALIEECVNDDAENPFVLVFGRGAGGRSGPQRKKWPGGPKRIFWPKRPTLWFPSHSVAKKGEGGVADGTRTRNNQNHNLGIYH